MWDVRRRGIAMDKMRSLTPPNIRGGLTVHIATDQRQFELHPVDLTNEPSEGYRDTGLTIWAVHTLLSDLLDQKPSPWIPCAERLPTEADEDAAGCIWVAFANKYGPHDVYYISAEGCSSDAEKGAATHWKPTGLVRPEPPEVEV